MGIAPTDGAGKTAKMAFRDEMTVAKSWAYFDHAAVSPIPQRTAKAMQNWVDQASCDGDVPWLQWSKKANMARTLASRLLHCNTNEIALIPNTTYGINIVAMGFPWKPGDSLVIPENEYPSNLLPWKSLTRLGVEIRTIRVDPSGAIDIDRIRQAIDHTTRLVTVSWVGYATGYRIDLGELCDVVHRSGAKLFVDAIQGMGIFDLDTRDIPIDYAAADGHKWMLGPEGAGVLYIRESNLEQLAPIMLGWNSVEASYEFHSDGSRLKKDASRYEGGSANLIGLIGFSESLSLLLELRGDQDQEDNWVASKVLENAARVRDAIRTAGGILNYAEPARWDASTGSGIVNFHMPGKEPMMVRKTLLESGVVISVRHGNLRAATHAYNNDEDIERLKNALRDA
jgi:selenocysteine lyase/cysteine desulfurase